jgi:uncharacterized protein (DUF362 family)
MSRRGFLAGAACGVLGSLAATKAGVAVDSPAPVTKHSRVALAQGPSRAGNILEVLKRIKPQIQEGIARKKRVIIKPNLVNVDRQLTSTHVECLEGILEFLGPLVPDEIGIAETPANGPAAEAFSNYGLYKLRDKYRVRFVDLDEQPFETEYLVDERHHPKPVRFSRFLLDPDTYYISTAPFKTHDRAVVTLGLKNFVVGGIIKDIGYRWGPGSRGVTDKHIVHGGPENQAINYNLFKLALRLRPDLSVLDGFQGMEHNGPVSGTPVDHRVAVAGTDWLAADRVGAELMGFDWRKVGYLVFSAQAGMGQTDLDRIDILGPSIRDLARPYRPHDTVEQQYKWM